MILIGNISLSGDSLMYLKDSASLGQQLEYAFTEAAKDMLEKECVSAFNANMMEEEFLSRDPGEFSRKWGRKWIGAEYEAGDVVLHHPCNIHCTAVNETEVIRLATDLRFVETVQKFDKR
jgi:phytanoyl-CoA hydroxylase